ncbi:sulfurtransferase TusA family protein [Pseudoalteromonas ostreae]|uniref:sulfurtransferase TusA family protein n=1 Tax=Pseudoalteromonas ostreae TaxID=2774154 RepID=UPI001B384890|nr:sulfurtransferase TusA family protein [Pseudoalteromonas ostreae]
MLEQDLRGFKCPQQFIQFKLALRQAATAKTIKFTLLVDQSTQDMERFLQKNHYQYKLEQQRGLLIVELNSV